MCWRPALEYRKLRNLVACSSQCFRIEDDFFVYRHPGPRIRTVVVARRIRTSLAGEFNSLVSSSCNANPQALWHLDKGAETHRAW